MKGTFNAAHRNALVGAGSKGIPWNAEELSASQEKRDSVRDHAREVGIENAEKRASHDSRRSKMTLSYGLTLDGDLLIRAASSRVTLTP